MQIKSQIITKNLINGEKIKQNNWGDNAGSMDNGTDTVDSTSI